jgi:uncharacterized protein
MFIMDLMPAGRALDVPARTAPAAQGVTRRRRHVAAQDYIGELTDRIVAAFRPMQVILFGSHARGEASDASDVDLLVVLPNVEDKRKAAIEIRRSLADLPVSKDIIVTSPEEISRRGNSIGSVLRPALREGRVLYERS